jgi:hypothetical protein
MKSGCQHLPPADSVKLRRAVYPARPHRGYCRILILVSLLVLFGATLDIPAQVINFDVPGGAGAANYSGQGAYADPGHNYWNAIVGGGTVVNNLLSDGVTSSPITLTSQLGGTYGTQGTQGTPAGLQQPYEYNSVALRQDSLNNVPAGTYALYLYGINNTGTRGTIFTVSSSLMPPVSKATVNTPASLTTFVAGADYVVFTNVVVGADGTIWFSFVANPDVTLSGNNEGDLNAIQLVHISTNTTVGASVGPNFGPNVLVFNPSMSEAAIQSFLNGVFAIQQNNQFGANRYAFFFQPGQYTNLDVNVGYYTQVLGLGQSPDNVTITGDVHSDGVLANHNATVNFWRSCENLAVVPTNSSTMTWAVSQGTDLRRMHVVGSLNLANTDNGAYSSGGFLADSKIDSTVNSVSQQQWLSRNDVWGSWSGQNWNMVFVGVSNAPSGTWPGSKFTVVNKTPYIAEKPYLYLDASNNYNVRVPALETTGTSGTTWAGGTTPGVSSPISQFYLAQPGLDNAVSISAAISSGRNVILTPGIYNLTNSILITRSNAIVLGLGYPTLVPTRGVPTLEISGVTGVKVAGIIFDAGPTASPSLLEVGTAITSTDYSANPVCLYDICSRVGGEFPGTTTTCVTINANNVVGDNLWLWRADHGNGVGWTQNASNSGLVVNGAGVTIYGLFVEHHENYQTLWNGNGGRVYFYQSELPYDPPSQSAWAHNGVNGYASYKVADTVTSHEAYGLGVYGVFLNSTAKCFNAIETPSTVQQVNVHDMITVYIAGQSGSEITHIINGTGPTLNTGVTTATTNYLWANPEFSVNAALGGPNIALSFPTESWHSYQVQYKNAPSAASWLNLGSPIGGNDAIQTVTNLMASPSRYYRVGSQ